MENAPFIACGMYTLSPELQRGWQALFDAFAVDGEHSAGSPARVVFDHNEPLLRDPQLIFGHTCGYPLMTRLQDALHPFCVPVFDVPGSDGRLYRSRFVVPADSRIESLPECRGAVVAVNGPDSNSGMNVLRHALARAGAKPGYFSDLLITGTHLNSLRAVAENRAQLAAIDCVSLQLIADLHPELVAGVRVIGDSEASCGLPLVMPIGMLTPARRDGWTAALNRALKNLPAATRLKLHLQRFEAVDIGDYASILELEKFAAESGYSTLN